jgi:para-nitrobenzyl esterase
MERSTSFGSTRVASLCISIAIIGAFAADARAQTITTPQGLFPAATYRAAAATNGVTVFKGIRYAASPTGERRFAPPFAPEPPSGTLDASTFGSACPQVASPFGVASTSEDCLFLNVYVPGNPGPANRLPVMVFLHGGAFVSGAGSLYDPTTLAKTESAIVVTVNYRLGTLGYMAAPELRAQDPRRSSGNYGLLDQEFALRWVQQNIGAFGGDRGRVTVFGQSAGGYSVCALLTAPSAAGLFQRAITQSGPCSFPLPAREASEASGTKFIEKVGCARDSDADTVDCLRQLDVQTVLDNQVSSRDLVGSPTGLTQYFPNVDGVVIPQQPVQAITLNQYNKVPVMIGTTQDEGTLFVALAFDLLDGPLTAQEYPNQIASVAATVASQAAAEGGSSSGLTTQLIGARILRTYPLRNYASPGQALAAVMTDASFACPALITAQLLSLTTITYSYEFADQASPMLFLPPVSFPYRASHTNDLQYLFDNLGSMPVSLSRDQQALAATMKEYWTEFAAAGTPNQLATTSPFWPAFTLVAPVTQSLVSPTPRAAIDFAVDHHCVFWQSVLLQGAALSALTAASGG